MSQNGQKKVREAFLKGQGSTQRVAAAEGGRHPLCERPKAALVPSKRLRGLFVDLFWTLWARTGSPERLRRPFFDLWGTFLIKFHPDIPKPLKLGFRPIPYFTE